MLLNPFIGAVGVGVGGGAGPGLVATDRGTGANSSAGTTLVITPASNLTAGSTAVLVLSMDNASGAGTNFTTTSYTDSVGNVWYVFLDVTSGTALGNVEGSVLTSYLTVDFTTSATLTLNFNTSTIAKAWTLTEIACGSGNFVIEARSTIGTVVTGGTAPTVTTVSGPNNGDVIMGIGFAESEDTWTEDGDTLNGTWSTKQSTGTGSGASGASVISQYKLCTAYGFQTYNPTLSAADVRIGYIWFSEVDARCRITGSSSATEAASGGTFRKPMAAGSIGVFCIAADNAIAGGGTTNLPTTPTDSKGNTWTLRQTGIYDPVGTSAGVEIGIYTGAIVTPIVRGDTLTITYLTTSVPSKAFNVFEFAPQFAGTMSYVTGALGSGAATGTPNVTTGSITNGDYVIGMCGLEFDNSFVGDSDTTNGTWKIHTTSGAGTGDTGMAITSQYKQVTGTATQSYDPTCTSGDTKIGWIEITET